MRFRIVGSLSLRMVVGLMPTWPWIDWLNVVKLHASVDESHCVVRNFQILGALVGLCVFFWVLDDCCTLFVEKYGKEAKCCAK